MKPEKPFEQKLQAAALELFLENGYRATSTRDIAAALGVKQGSLYYYIKNKEDVLYAICYSSLQHVIDSVTAAAAQAENPLESMRCILATHLRSTLEQRKQLFVSIADYRSLSETRVNQIKLFWRDYQTFVSSVLEQGKKHATIRRDISDKYLYLIAMSTINWTVLWYRPDQALKPDELGTLYTNVLVDGAATLAERNAGAPARLRRESAHSALPPIDAGSNSTHARLLDTASTLFARSGFSNTSIREIAEAVGLEKASLYHYLSSKDELSFEISREAHLHLAAGVRQALAGATHADEKLYALIVAHVTCLLQHQDWHATANEQLGAMDEARRGKIVALRDAYEVQVRTLIAEAQASGLLRQDMTAKTLGMVLLGMITHVYPWYEPDRDIAPKELALTIADIFLNGIRA